MSSPRRVVFWVILAMLAVGALLEGPQLGATFGVGELTVVVWLGAALQLGALLLIALAALPRRQVTPGVVLFSILLGGFFATGVAAEFNNGSALVAPFAEELLKLVCVAAMLWFLRPSLRGPLDGLVIGYYVGLGFEVVEDIGYAAIAGAKSGSEAAITEVIARMINGFALHNFCTAIAGAALALAFWHGGRAWLTALGGLAAAIAIHFLWDNVSLAEPVGHGVIYALMIAAFVLTRIWATRVERAASPGAPGLDPEPDPGPLGSART